jgi:multidrug efflux pump subunit AcrA (membrane-fusion protein)
MDNSNNSTTVYSFPPTPEDHEYATSPEGMLEVHDLPEAARVLSRLLIVFFLFMVLFLIIVPWQQASQGFGRVMAYRPQDRVQNVHATVSGRIKQWFVQEGSEVKANDPILELIDIDPQYLERITIERDAAKSAYEAAQSVTKTAQIDMDRQEDLFNKGISSRKDMEHAIISYKTAQSAEAAALAALTQAESKISRQQTQIVRAPTDGTIVRLLIGTSSVVVEQGQVVAIFVPKSKDLLVELFIKGSDLPLVYEGRRVRLQFEGWPAIQFSGWPSVAVGTFGGTVVFVDQTASAEGLFRVLVGPGAEDKWPDNRYLRQGTRVNGWIQLNRVSLGYEVWRQFNGFPPALDQIPTDIGAPEFTIPE